jgi:hypothetical protein
MLSMKTALIVLLFASTAVWGQTASTSTLPDGVKLPVSLIDDLQLAHLSLGDQVRFVVTSNLRGPGGAIAIPKGAIAIGRVREIEMKSKDKPARLYLVFEEVTWKEGRMALHAYPLPPLLPPKSSIVTRPNGIVTRPNQIMPEEALYVGFEPHSSAGSVMHSDQNFRLMAGTTCFIQQMSKPGPASVPVHRPY